MALPIRSSEADDEEEPPTSIDQCLVDAVLHPQFRDKLLGMEAKIHQVLEDPNLEKVEFPECHTFHLKSLADKLARHYRLESRCKERRAFARKMPDSKIPSVTLSGILVKRSNGAASSSTTLSLPEFTDPVKREEEHCKAREIIFNESGPASSTAPLVSSSTPPVASSSSSLAVSRATSPIHNGIGKNVDQDEGLSDMHAEMNPVHNPGTSMASSSSSRAVSRSASPIHNGIGKDVDQDDGLSDMHAETNPVHNPGTSMAPSFRSPSVSRSASPIHNGIAEEVNQDDGLSDMHAEMNLVNNHGANMASSFRSLSVSRSTSPNYSEIGEEVNQDGLSDIHTQTNLVHMSGTNMNHSPTNSMYGRGTGVFNEVPTTGQQPFPMQNEPRIQQSQMYQYGSSIEQPQMMQYEPSIAQPYMNIPFYNYYPYNPAFPSGAGTSPYYACCPPQLAWVQLVQPIWQEPMQYQYQYQPGTAQQPTNASSFIQNNQGAVRPRRTSYDRARGRSL